MVVASPEEYAVRRWESAGRKQEARRLRAAAASAMVALREREWRRGRSNAVYW